MAKKRIAIVDGVRTPFCRAGGIFNRISADDLGAAVVKELCSRHEGLVDQVDELIFGNVAQPANAANVARVIALKGGLSKRVPAYTVHRNCASGMEAITTATSKIRAGEGDVYIVGGAESMSNIPLMFNQKMTDFFIQLMKSKSLMSKLKTFLSFRPSFLKPVIAVQEGLTDPFCGLNMGMTAEVLSREFHVTREQQDVFSLESHKRAAQATAAGLFADEILPVPVAPAYDFVQSSDDGIRKEQSIEALKKLKPYFDRITGSVTVGNACGLTDGAGSLLIMSEEKAKELSLNPLGYLKDFAYAGLDPERMGLGPVYSTAKLLNSLEMSMDDIDLIELNEAFAAQVLANEIAFDSDDFAKKYLNQEKKVGFLDPDKMNVNGGAIALGHPVGATGARMVLTLLKEMQRKNLNTGLATLCIGGGQGAALLLERE
ncbi:MAG: acetyl-CoA C-acyltransferase [Planctomycetota bacterium]|nr:MAG: acetyl-CoA C-acyltransferase [Planctomycetota bacterium]